MSFLGRLFNFESEEDKRLRRKLKEIFGFQPNDLRYYRQSLTHKSAVDESRYSIDSNERLEFLGDAIIGSCVADFLYMKYPNADEGFLTQLRSKIVSRKHLNAVATQLGVDDFIVANIDNKQRVNSIKGNAFEALVGAIYLDKGNQFCLRFIAKLVKDGLIDLDKLSTVNENFKSLLIEFGQKEKKNIEFKLISERGKGYDKQFKMKVEVDGEVLGAGEGRSKKIAEQAAAKEAAKSLKIDA